MWFIESDNVIRVKGLRSVESEEYVNNATVTGILYKLPVLNPNAGGAVVDKAPGTGVGIPCTGHGIDVLSSVRLEKFQNYNGDYIVMAGSSSDEIVIEATYVAETLTGEEFIYEAIVGTVLSPITFQYVDSSDGDYVGKIDNGTPLIQGEHYMMCIWEVSGAEQVLAKIIDEAGYCGL